MFASANGCNYLSESIKHTDLLCTAVLSVQLKTIIENKIFLNGQMVLVHLYKDFMKPLLRQK